MKTGGKTNNNREKSERKTTLFPKGLKTPVHQCSGERILAGHWTSNVRWKLHWPPVRSDAFWLVFRYLKHPTTPPKRLSFGGAIVDSAISKTSTSQDFNGIPRPYSTFWNAGKAQAIGLNRQWHVVFCFKVVTTWVSCRRLLSSQETIFCLGCSFTKTNIDNNSNQTHKLTHVPFRSI